ncbi:MAG: tryptophan synthase subunit alpha [Candidatus Zapsychrus exili]|nr:tryptophan synthase subunit alpha [Candidatus Zapsychrus exili]
MSRIDRKFKSLKKENKKAFIAFITAGDPDIKTTEELVVSFERSGVDIIEIGVPFSDPLADGPTIQASSQRALKKGINLDKIFEVVKRIRKKTEVPIALMTYYNPVFYYGEVKFIEKAKEAGIDGIIVPDLPPEEAKVLIKEAKKKDISTIFFLSPTTSKKRIKIIVESSSGFIYYVALTGVTGARSEISSDLLVKIKEAKKYTSKPICVGFGVSNNFQVKKICKAADGVIGGSAIINEIIKNKAKKNLVRNVSSFVHKLAS